MLGTKYDLPRHRIAWCFHLKMPKKQSIQHCKIASLVSISQEMDNPLTAIYVRLHSLRQPRPKQAQLDLLAAIEKDLRRLNLVVKQFKLDVSNILESEGPNARRKK